MRKSLIIEILLVMATLCRPKRFVLFMLVLFALQLTNVTQVKTRYCVSVAKAQTANLTKTLYYCFALTVMEEHTS